MTAVTGQRTGLLGEPIQLGPMRLKNRIAMLPHGLMYAIRPEQRPNERHRAYYEARAKGGAGLICLESSVIAPDARSVHSLVLSGDPGCVPGYCAIADTVHEHGAKISGQLVHYGNEAASAITRAPLVGPSAVPDPVVREACLALDADGMRRILEQHVAAARNFADAGFDAIELKVAHDGLMRQFLSPLANHRDDEYGGSVENRMRYPLEIYRAIRAEVGDGIALSVRLDIDEVIPGGFDLDDGIAFAKLFEASGVIDYLSADEGIIGSLDHVIAPMAHPPGYAVDKVAAVREQVGLPIIAFGRLSDPEQAERILREGKADVIGFARQMLADPEYANKVLGGHGDRVRPCTACNQMCLGHSEHDRPVSCTVNPFAGHGERRPRVAGARGTAIVVVGAGPAGLEAARTRAEDGARVVLLERDETLGGQLAVARLLGGRVGWQPYLDWLEREVLRLGVEVRRGVPADADAVLEHDPGAVIVATGSVAGPAALDGVPAVGVEGYANRADLAGGRVVVADLGVAGPAYWFTALEAARRGASEVVVVTPEPMVGSDLDTATRMKLQKDLAPFAVRPLVGHAVTGAQDGHVVAAAAFGGATVRLAADLVVCTTPRVSSGGTLVAALRARGAEVVAIGDALVPRDAPAAIREGQEAGGALSGAGTAAGASPGTR